VVCQEEVCHEYLWRLRWPEGFLCPWCEGQETWAMRRGVAWCRPLLSQALMYKILESQESSAYPYKIKYSSVSERQFRSIAPFLPGSKPVLPPHPLAALTDTKLRQFSGVDFTRYQWRQLGPAWFD